MPNHTSFRLNRSGMLLALISAAFAGEAGAVAGHVDFATSGATIASRDGQQRPLAKGAELDSGDTIRTDTAGRAQIRFTDGSYVSLQPNTEFSIKDYNFEGKTDGSERGFFGLAKGAMRAVTGLVGRVNRNKYQISTPTATVGIRGTGGRIEVLLDGSTLIAGTSGIWTLTNPSGTLDVPAGRFGRAPAAPNQPPRQSTQGPDTGPAPLPVDPPKPVEVKGVEKEIDSSCQKNPTSAACTDSIVVVEKQTPPAAPPPEQPPVQTPAVLVSGSGYAFARAFTDGDSRENSHFLESTTNEAATFNSAGQLTEVTYSTSAARLEPGGSHADFGTDGILAWGRWVGPVTITSGEIGTITYRPDQGLHYVIGVPTAVMPTTGDATYTMIGATRPTYTDGRTGPGTFTGSLGVTFGSTAHAVSGSFNVVMPDNTYSWSASGTTSNALFQLPTITAISCPSTCSASVHGFFAGANAVRAGIAYTFTDAAGASKTFIGAAAFTKGPSTPPVQQ